MEHLIKMMGKSFRIFILTLVNGNGNDYDLPWERLFGEHDASVIEAGLLGLSRTGGKGTARVCN